MLAILCTVKYFNVFFLRGQEKIKNSPGGRQKYGEAAPQKRLFACLGGTSAAGGKKNGTDKKKNAIINRK